MIPALVRINWVDSRQPLPSWMWRSDFGEPSVVQCSSVGWLIEDGDIKVIAQSIGDVESDNFQMAGVKQIPAGCVTGLLVLSEPVGESGGNKCGE